MLLGFFCVVAFLDICILLRKYIQTSKVNYVNFIVQIYQAHYNSFARKIITAEEMHSIYHKISNIKYTKSQNLDVSRLVLQLSLLNQLKPGVKSRMKM